MYFAIYGILSAALALICFTIDSRTRGNLFAMAFVAPVIGLVAGFAGWTSMPTFAWNFEGNWMILFVVGLAIVGTCMLVASENRSYNSLAVHGSFITWLPLTAAASMLLPVQIFTSAALLHDTKYRALIGEVVDSEFSADVGVVDVRQVRTVDQTLASELGSKPIEGQSGLGTRVALGTMNIQTVNGCFSVLDGDGDASELCFEDELVWVGPLDHSSAVKAWRNVTTPGYIIVSATDSSQYHMVTGLVDAETEAVEELQLQYLNNGIFSNWNYRHVRNNGYAAVGVTDFSFEIDNTGRPFWVITRFDRTIGFSGDDPIGVVVMDVQTGDITEYGIEDAPDWIDRIQPEGMVNDQLTYWGEYVLGFWNSWAFGQGLQIVKPTPGMSLVYGADGRSYWYSGMQSAGADTGTNSFMLIDTRTGDARRYDVSGFNETAAKQAAESAPSIAEAGYTGTDPILYNTGGEPTYFLALKGDGGLAKAYAFVNLGNAEIVGVGRNPAAAFRDYQNALIGSGRNLSAQGTAAFERFEAAIVDAVQVGGATYLRFDEHPDQEFFGTNDISPELKWARPGMTAIVVYQAGSDTSQQIFEFDLPNMAISQIDAE